MSVTDWSEFWEQDKYEVGRAMHEGWKRQKIRNGFADHPYKSGGKADNGERRCLKCYGPEDRHHPDMIDWDALLPQQQAINYEGGREGYRLGFERGHEVGHEAGYEMGEDAGRDIGYDEGVMDCDDRYEEGYDEGHSEGLLESADACEEACCAKC
jgi:hypothetical protein